ncbi:MAG: NUDIX hydrolase [Spirochaetales bacterium]|nr:NUDIX hydrolase [Spirochaetales bacterium]
MARDERYALQEALETYRRRWPEEEDVVRRFTTLLSTWPQCLERTSLPGHITASGWVVHGSSEEVLLTHHRKLGRWLQLGGHADGEGDVVGVARREVAEESGIEHLLLWAEGADEGGTGAFFPTPFDIDIHEIPPHKTVPAHLHYDLRFAFLVSDFKAPVVSEESHDVAWVPLDRLDDYTDEESMLRMRRKWLDTYGRDVQ